MGIRFLCVPNPKPCDIDLVVCRDFAGREATVVEADSERSEDVPMAGRKGVWARFEKCEVCESRR